MKISFSKEQLKTAALLELRRRRLTESGEIHPFFTFKPKNVSQESFLRCRARTQVVTGSNRSGKTRVGDQKCLIAIRGFDPAGLVPDYPKCEDRVFKVWLCVPAKFTLDTLKEFRRMIPPDMKYKAYYSRGEERIEFEPTERRPHGAVAAVKSYGMPRDEFQREAVDIVRFDEEPPEYIWTECEQRLISTKGTLILTFTPVNGATWLYKRLREMKAQYMNAVDGDFAWFRFLVQENDAVDWNEVQLRSRGMSEDEYAIRIEGRYIVMAGSEYFPPEHLKAQWDAFSTNPSWTMTFGMDGEPVFQPWKGQEKGWVVWKKPSYGLTFGMGADVGKGVGGDYSVAVILERDTGEMCAVFSDNEIDPWEYGQELLLAATYYNDALVAPEVNVEASATLHAMRQFGYPHIYRRKTFGGRLKDMQNSLGWYTDRNSKGSACEELRAAIKKGAKQEPGGVIIRDAKTFEQLSDFFHLKEKRPGSHGLGGLSDHDDRVMALAIAWQALKEVPRGMTFHRQVEFKTQVERWEQELINANRRASFGDQDD